jgi:multidrug efflux system membrane fusion protein
MNLSPPRHIAQGRTVPGPTARRSKAKPRIGKWLASGALILVLGAYWYFTNGNNMPASAVPGALLAQWQQLIGAGKASESVLPAGRRPNNAAPVRVAQALRRDMQVIRRTPGTVVANTLVQITARVQGIIQSANFKEGQFVKKGDLLFQIDPRPFEAALEQSRAVLVRDQAALKNANRDKDLYDHLNQIGAVSKQQRDTQESNVEVLIATIAADQAAINLAVLNLEYTQIRSPVNGKTGPMLIQPGNMVLATGTTPLVTIAEIQPVKISFNLSQADLPLILARQKENRLVATVDTKDPNNEPVSAPIDFSSNAVNDKSGTVELRATFDNRDYSFLPGQLVSVTVELDTIPNAVVVPRDAVSEGADGSFVYVVTNDKARQQSIKVLFDDGKYAAIGGEVKPGDQVVVEGQLRVDPSGAVNVVSPQQVSPDQEAEASRLAPSQGGLDGSSAQVLRQAPAEEAASTDAPPARLDPAPAPAAKPEAAPKAPAVVANTVPAPSPATGPAPAPAIGSVLLQIGSYESPEIANGAWAAFKAQHAAVVGGLSQDVQKADLGAKGTWYRLRLGPFADKGAANAACEKLKAEGGACFVAPP